MDELVDIPYDANPLQKLDLYIPLSDSDEPLSKPLVCFVHGGAWRSEDKSHHAELAKRLALATNYPVAVPNYRLTTAATPDVRHPAHADDLLRALVFLHQSPPSSLYDPRRIYLMGHSCSAHMLTSILLDSSSTSPSLTPTPSLLAAVQAVVLSEGIYDFALLLSSFPAYRDSFVAPAFGAETGPDAYRSFSTTLYPLREGARHIRWLIVHSKGDTLVDQLQSEAIYDHLRTLYDGAGVIEERILKNWDELVEEHNDLLRGTLFVRIAASFIKSPHQ